MWVTPSIQPCKSEVKTMVDSQEEDAFSHEATSEKGKSKLTFWPTR